MKEEDGGGASRDLCEESSFQINEISNMCWAILYLQRQHNTLHIWSPYLRTTMVHILKFAFQNQRLFFDSKKCLDRNMYSFEISCKSPLYNLIDSTRLVCWCSKSAQTGRRVHPSDLHKLLAQLPRNTKSKVNMCSTQSKYRITFKIRDQSTGIYGIRNLWWRHLTKTLLLPNPVVQAESYQLAIL